MVRLSVPVKTIRRFFTWICRKLSGRDDTSVVLSLPEAWKETQPPAGERFVRYIFGAPFSDKFTAKSFFWRWVGRILLIWIYLGFLWILYESLWAWNIFGGE